MFQIEKLPVDPLSHGVSPFFDNKTNSLFVSDLNLGDIYKIDLETKEFLKLSLESQPVSFIIPIFLKANNFICGEGSMIKTFEWNFSANTAENVNTLDCISQSDIQFTIGKCDGCGQLWAGTASTINYQGPDASLFSFKKGDGLIKQMGDIYESSGLAWNVQNDILFHCDSLKSSIDAYNFELIPGNLRNKQEVFDFKKNLVKGSPNGIATDQNGNLWIGCYNGSQIININPETGTLLRTIQLPTNQITSLTFGGHFTDELYITSASKYFDPLDKQRYLDAGSIYRIKNLNVKGIELHSFK